MITSTHAYAAHKKQSVELLDFAVLVCHAVPELKRTARLIEKGTVAHLARPDYFGGQHPAAQLRDHAKRYKSDLAIHIVLSSFALFDGYFQQACREVLTFHGGAKLIATRLSQLRAQLAATLPNERHADFAQLRDYVKPHKKVAYRAAIDRIKRGGYSLPSAFFSGHGVLHLERLLNDGVRARQIPELMKECFDFDLGARAQDYSRIRNLRNKLAHSERTTCALKTAMKDAKTLRSIVVEFDAHLVRQFLVIEWV
jgi:hypothetical protein